MSAPTPVSPINNEMASSLSPVITAANATWVGPVGGLTYEFQVATDQAFSTLVAAGIVNEGSGQTTFTSSPLTASATLFWRVRASDGENASSWSVDAGFRTPAPPAPPPPTPTPPGGGGAVDRARRRTATSS